MESVSRLASRSEKESALQWASQLGSESASVPVRRLTRVHARSVEQPNNPEDVDDFFNWPWMVAGEMGDWKLTEAHAATLREYLLRGGFLYMDDFWNDDEWERFMESMRIVFPDRTWQIRSGKTMRAVAFGPSMRTWVTSCLRPGLVRFTKLAMVSFTCASVDGT